MAYDINAAIPGLTQNVADFLQIEENLSQLEGSAAGQTVIPMAAELSIASPLIFGHATLADIRRAFTTALLEGGNVAEIAFRAEDPDAIEDENYVGLIQVIGQDGGSVQEMGILKFKRIAPLTGIMQIAALGSFDTDIYLVPGAVAIEPGYELPEYALDIPSGYINVSGDYLENGVPLDDWTHTPGSPDEVEWEGNAKVLRSLISLVPDGTAPIVLDGGSQTVCPLLDAEYLSGFHRHDGLKALNAAAYSASDTQITTLNLNGTAGSKWTIAAAVSVSCGAAGDVGKTVNIKLRNATPTQIGDTVPVTFSSQYSVVSVLIVGTYTAGAGTEGIDVSVAVPTGTGGTASAGLVAVWEGP